MLLIPLYTFKTFWLPVEMQIFFLPSSFRLSGCISSDPLRNRFIGGASRRRWERVFGSWRERRAENWVEEVSDFSAVPRNIWPGWWEIPESQSLRNPAYYQNGLPWYFCHALSLAESSPWEVWPWGKYSDGSREIGSEVVSQLALMISSLRGAFS